MILILEMDRSPNLPNKTYDADIHTARQKEGKMEIVEGNRNRRMRGGRLEDEC